MKVYVKNKIFSLGGSSAVVDENKQDVYRVKGKVFSFHHKKVVCDLNGKALYFTKNRLINLWSHKVRVYDGATKQKIATVRDKVVSLKPVYFIDGTTDEYKIEGEFLSLTCNITRNGQVIGTIRRQITLIADAFELEASEADMPFCIALCIAVDNIVDAIRRDVRK